MIQWGVNALNHGHSIAVFDNGKLVDNYTGSRDTLESATTVRALAAGSPDRIYWYENPWLKKARQLYAGQYQTALRLDVLPTRYMKQFKYAPITYTAHHASHAAAGYYTSPFDHCAVVVLDAIGEFESATIWEGNHGSLRKVWSRSYPHSLGLYYSAFTKMLGLQPIRDEHILQQMAELGNSRRFQNNVAQYFDKSVLKLNYNFHRGVQNWDIGGWSVQDQCDLAAAVQQQFEIQVDMIMLKARQLTNSNSLVYMGGCAMNSKANKNVVKRWQYVWSLPNPGDPSSSIGAVAYHNRQRICCHWDPVKHIEIKI